jgi:predicted amidohydrolase
MERTSLAAKGMTMSDSPRGLSRRSLLGGAAGLGLAAALPFSAANAGGLQPRGPSQVRPDGSYEVVPLAKNVISLGVVQSRVIPVDLSNLNRTRKANLDHMLRLIDSSTIAFGKPDLLFFHEFPITGWHNWSRDEVLKVAIEVPGEETEAIARKAREHGMYIVFGSYVREPDWRGHALSITTFIGPDGKIIDKHWKARNVKGMFGGDVELFTTTIYDVLERYVEMYGEDAVLPVTRTPIGNFVTSSIQREPEYFRAAALKGAEIILRTATGGFHPVDIQATSLYNQVYTAICNNAVSTGSPFFEDSHAGGSAIYGPDGSQIAEATSHHETLVSARIPIADFRSRHRQPVLHKELYLGEYQQYVPPFPPNLFQDYQPSDLRDAGRYIKGRGRWQ